MRRVLAVLILAAMWAVPPGASADHRPLTVCSQTGDICQSVARVDGVRVFRITLAAGYFSDYRLCVTGPKATSCGRFSVHEAEGGTFASTVRWSRHFEKQGPGAYTVVWRSLPGNTRVGSVLGFHTG